MFERFTDRARKVMALANQAAQRFGHEYIDTEHILLGLVREGCGVGANVVKNLGVDLPGIRVEVEKVIRRVPDIYRLGKLPMTPRAKKVIEYAIEEARRLNHDYVGTEHLLLGLLREEEGIACVVLTNLGVSLDAARREVLNLLGTATESRSSVQRAEGSEAHAVYARFTDHAHRAMTLASEEALRLNHEYVGSEHILMGIARQGSGVGGRVLADLGIDLAKLRAEVEKLVKRGSQPPTIASLPETPRAKKAIAEAIEEARRLSHNSVGTDHLLLGVLNDPESVAAEVLTNLGHRLDDIREKVLARLTSSAAPPTSSQFPEQSQFDLKLNPPQRLYRRFSDRARKIFALANQEAQRFNHEQIDTEHILLGLVKEGTGVGPKVLKDFDIDLRRIRLEVMKRVPRGPDMITSGKIPQTPRAHRVIEHAIAEAGRLGHDYVGSEHLLLGLLREDEDIAAQILVSLGVTLDAARREVLESVPAAEPGTLPRASLWSVRKSPSRYERFTDHARRAMSVANAEAQHLNQEELDIEHILMGIARVAGIGARLLADLGADSTRLRAEFEKLAQPGPGCPPVTSLALSPRAEKAIESAMEEARQLSHDYVGTDHLLLAVLTDSDSVAGQMLENLGLNLDAARARTRELLRAAPSSESSPAEIRTTGRTGPTRETHSWYDCFTERAHSAITCANEEAQRLNHEYIGTEHILLGVRKEGTGIGARALADLGIDLAMLRAELEKLVKRGFDPPPPGKLPPTPSAERLIEYAIEEAQSLKHSYICTEHLLLGTLRVQDGVAVQMLINLGFTPELVRAKVLSLLAEEAMAPSPQEKSADAIRQAIQSLMLANRRAAAEGDSAFATELLDKIEQLRALLVKPPARADDTPSPAPPSIAPTTDEAGIPCPNDKCVYMNEPLARFCSRCGRPLQA